MTNPTIFLSFAAGVLSFLSPCILPLIPSYLSYIGGVTLSDLRTSQSPKSGVVVRTALFVAGFSAVFIALGVLFSGSGFLFSRAAATISLVAGLVVVLLGINMIFDFWKFVNIERRFHFSGRPSGYVGSVAIGMAFGAGWTPCVGPILAGILFLAGNSGKVWLGVLYLAAFSAGLGVPFLLASIFFRQVTTQLARMKQYFGALRVMSGLLLVAIGLLIAFGRLQEFNNAVVGAGVAIHDWHDAAPQNANRLLGSISLLLGLLVMIPGLLRALRNRTPVERTETNADPGPAASRPRRFLSPAGFLFVGLFLIIGVLQFAGIIDLAAILYQWLTFQGI